MLRDPSAVASLRDTGASVTMTTVTIIATTTKTATPIANMAE
jgi:hypothetical protein